MYRINTKEDRPDIDYMFKEVKRMMDRGIKLVDLNEVYKQYKPLKDRLYNEFHEKYGVSNPNSAVQLASYLSALSDRMVENGQQNDIYEVCFVDGKWTTNKEAMLKLSEIGYEFATDLLIYRTVKSYTQSIESLMKEACGTGIINPKVALGKTHRIQYSAPALLSIPKELTWNLIKPFKDGDKLYSVDIKNQEPNILINIIDDDELKKALTAEEGLYEYIFSRVYAPMVTLNIAVAPAGSPVEPRLLSNEELEANPSISSAFYSPVRPSCKSAYVNGSRIELLNVYNTMTAVNKEVVLPDEVEVFCEDGKVHSLKVEWIDGDKVYKKPGTYSISGRILGVNVKCSKVERKEFKTAWLAMTYGASRPGIMAMCKSIDGSQIYNYFNSIEGFKRYNSMCSKMGRQGMQSIKTVFGTVMYANEPDPRRLKRVLMDLPIQGTGADILSLLIKHFNKTMQDKGLMGKVEIYFTRHDELIIEVDGETAKELGDAGVEELLRDTLEHQINDWTPFKVEVKELKPGELPGINDYNLEDDD